MINKYNLFLITSCIIGMMIGLYYKKFNKEFMITLFIAVLIMYSLYYLLEIDKEVLEKYENVIYADIGNMLDKLDNYTENNDTKEYHQEEHHQEEHHQEEHHQEEHHQEEHHQEEHHQEEHHEEKQHKKPKQPKKVKQHSISLVPTEEEQPDKTHNLPIGLTEKYLPFNINISYNAQNSTNNLNNGDKDKGISGGYVNTVPIPSKNLGPIGNCGLSRIYNNQDWIYGSNAWTNDPDYYIPHKTEHCPQTIIPKEKKPLNEIAMSKFKDNTEACPIEINTPWTEWLSGDEPEPFNL